MTIPNKPLILTYDAQEMTLGEFSLFNSSTSLTVNERADGMIKFLIAHSNWTRDEIFAIKLTEFKDIGQQIGDSLKLNAVPKAKHPRSKVGRGSKKK